MTKRLRIGLALSLALLFGLTAAGVFAQNIDPLSIGSKYAWGENIGWLNAQPSGTSGPGLTVTSTDVTGYMWSENTGWVNFSCQTNSLCGGAASAWGVKNDGAGHLSGCAWSENAGWLNLSCRTDSSCGGAVGAWGVDVSASTGVFSGQAWGENVGWITFNCATTASCGTAAYKVQTGWHPAALPVGGLSEPPRPAARPSAAQSPARRSIGLVAGAATSLVAATALIAAWRRRRVRA